jgi:hypothetical protein
MEIRSSKEATAYRRYLVELLQLARAGTTSDNARLETQLKELQTKMDKWRADPLEGVQYNTSPIDIAKFSPFTRGFEMKRSLPKLLGTILWNREVPQLVFVSRWFRDRTAALADLR